MSPRFLLDAHIVVRWLVEPRKLSREQRRVLRAAIRHREAVLVSAITLLEIAVLFGYPASELLGELESNPAFQIAPLTAEIASEVAALGGSLRDPADRAIVATARALPPKHWTNNG